MTGVSGTHLGFSGALNWVGLFSVVYIAVVAFLLTKVLCYLLCFLDIHTIQADVLAELALVTDTLLDVQTHHQKLGNAACLLSITSYAMKSSMAGALLQLGGDWGFCCM